MNERNRKRRKLWQKGKKELGSKQKKECGSMSQMVTKRGRYLITNSY